MRYLIFMLPILLYSQTLQELFQSADASNGLIHAQKEQLQAKGHELESAKAAYVPTLDVGALYQRYDERSNFMPGSTYGAYARLGLSIYDGGAKSSAVTQKSSEQKSQQYSLEAKRQELYLAIAQNFFTLRSLHASLEAYEQSQKLLEAQLERVKAFLDARVATEDEVDRLQAAFDTNLYEIESLRLEIIRVQKSLELRSGLALSDTPSSRFIAPSDLEGSELDSIQALRLQADAMREAAESIESHYYPNISLEDTYSFYGYSDYDATHPKGVDNQNKLLVTMNIRLFDYGVLDEQSQAVRLGAKALQSQADYYAQEQQMQRSLSIQRIKASELKIKSAQSALRAASSALESITKKFSAGIVDNVAFLDALAAQTRAKALYESSLNELQIAYALYYYFHAKNIEEYLQ